jgi:hypothetical protein
VVKNCSRFTLCPTCTALCVARTVLRFNSVLYNGSMLNTRTASPLSIAMTEAPLTVTLSAPSPFIHRLQLVAANRAEVRRKRPVLADGSATFVRSAVLNLMRSR